MSYFHGVYNSEIDTSLTAPIQGSAGLQVIFGTAPIHLSRDPAAVNKPMLCYSFAECSQNVGYSDNFPYMASVSNITVTAGGAEIESDDHLAERVYLFPGSYSTAGPEANYKYHAKKYSVNVGDVVVVSEQAAGTVDIYFLMADGTTPPEEMITGLQNYLRDNNIRPMTDLVTVAAPEEIAGE